jgi:hypothetical protein
MQTLSHGLPTVIYFSCHQKVYAWPSCHSKQIQNLEPNLSKNGFNPENSCIHKYTSFLDVMKYNAP